MAGSGGGSPLTKDSRAGPGALTLARAERRQQFATRGLVEDRQVDRTVALVAQNFNQGRPSLFRRRLKLTIRDAQQVHLQRLDEKILCVSAVGAR